MKHKSHGFVILPVAFPPVPTEPPVTGSFPGHIIRIVFVFDCAIVYIVVKIFAEKNLRIGRIGYRDTLISPPGSKENAACAAILLQ